MRAVIQRVERANVQVESETVGQIGKGLFILLGIAEGDKEDEARKLAKKIASLRVFSDKEGKLRLGAEDVEGSFLVVSNFTLYGDCRRGRRPDFTRAASPEKARNLYHIFIGALTESGFPVETGRFGADMQIEQVLDGPMTLVLDTDDWRQQTT
ncbi:MAG TPA: D-tyrosyl-tRNA(Tyr) deacylase [Ruminococcaceae bacterium]|nr:D-tyrosyl-tRNA(Tyr) deacylase [Oscillospiraceae bacterium]